jgi:hypothetical protein
MFTYKVVDAPRIQCAVLSENDTDPADSINPAQPKHLESLPLSVCEGSMFWRGMSWEMIQSEPYISH